MKCSNCGNEIPSTSRFCLSCGKAIGATGAMAPAREQGRKGLWIVAAVAGLLIVAVAAAAFFMLRGRAVTQATPVPNPQQNPVASAPNVPNPPQANVLQTEVKKPPLDVNNPRKPAPPADVVAYLEHLKKVEERRQQVYASELNSLFAGAGEMVKDIIPDWSNSDAPDTPDVRPLTQKRREYTEDWQELTKYLLSAPAPAQCAQLFDKYYGALGQAIRLFNDYQAAMSDPAKPDIAKLQGLKTRHWEVDKKLDAAERELAAVCDRYGIDKSFSIQSESGDRRVF